MKTNESKPIPFKEKLRAEAKRKEKAKRKQAELFRQKYDKVKVFEFPKKNKINMEKHFYFPKFLDTPCFQDLSKTALAVYTVLCSKADFEENNWFQISQENIAKMAGINPAQVKSGVEELINSRISIDSENPLLERKMSNEGKRHFYMYRVGFIRKEMISVAEKFIFHTCIIDTGIWAKLTTRAKALYLAMRTVAKFDQDLYNLIEYGESPYIKVEDFRNRLWDVWDSSMISMAELCRWVNIESSNIRDVIQQLEKVYLIERVDRYFKVYLKPEIENQCD